MDRTIRHQKLRVGHANCEISLIIFIQIEISQMDVGYKNLEFRERVQVVNINLGAKDL